MPTPKSEGRAFIHIPGTDRQVEFWKAWYYCPGDFNRDDVVDASDLADFMLTFTSLEGEWVELLDVTRDGWIDDDDVIEFLRAFDDAECDPAQKQEYRSHIC